MATINLPEVGEQNWGLKLNTAVTTLNDDIGLVQTQAEGAASDATTALSTANTAQSTADSASTTAGSASALATNAQADATQALNEIAMIGDPALRTFRTIIFYGWPILVNGVGTVEKAAQVFSRWDVIVFGDGLQDPLHEQHLNTIAIIARIKEINPRARVYGYVSLGVTTANHTVLEMQEKVDDWQTLMGAEGMLLDEMGYEYSVDRTRQNTMIDYVHGKSMSGLLNVWNSDHVFTTAVDPLYPAFDPAGVPTTADETDFMLLESWIASFNFYAEPTYDNWYNLRGDIITRGDKARTARTTYGTKVIGSSIVDLSLVTEAEAREYFEATQRFSRIFGLDGWSCDAYLYSSGGGVGNDQSVKEWTYDTSDFDKDAPYTLVDGWVFWSTFLRYDTGETIDLDETTLRWFPDRTAGPDYVTNRAGNRVVLEAMDEWLTVDFPDESTDDAPNRLEFKFAGNRTGYFNEYGEGRFIAARNSTVALRCFGSTTSHTGNIFEVAERDNVRKIFTVSQTTTVSDNPVTLPYAVFGTTRLYVQPTDPGAVPEGSVWIDSSGA